MSKSGSSPPFRPRRAEGGIHGAPLLTLIAAPLKAVINTRDLHRAKCLALKARKHS
eukprot:CAMPEP_0181321084 /NCGR_PEP_ID=MMETSP1101-20121128/18480_1 /TAXON_ID=46948 /ORGANISM="Rhodomonas abbreviata, Strain Caron Lab Isolate" /LENGTH=55 /DNA_ID=CAMNT_0023428855 /DNA_START=58 /DNA_END=221 /DNA_ORIENTATION=+